MNAAEVLERAREYQTAIGEAADALVEIAADTAEAAIGTPEYAAREEDWFAAARWAKEAKKAAFELYDLQAERLADAINAETRQWVENL